MPLKITNPYNKIDLSRLTAETAVSLVSDLLVFHDASVVSGQKERSITVQGFLTAVLPTLTLSIQPTGARIGYVGLTAPTGWVLGAGKTIGSSSSGATERANSDTLALYTLLWESYSNVELIIQTSAGANTTRGGSAATDFAANKRLPVPDYRGRIGLGKDDMGGTAANRITSAGCGITGITLGASGGAQTHALIEAELAAHTHDTLVPATTAATAATGTDVATPGAGAAVVSDAAGSGTAHNNVQPSIVETVIIKL